MTLTPDQVLRNDFTENLGTDVVAVNANGTVIGRAGSEDTARRANPDAAAFFTGKDFEATSSKPTRAATAELDSTAAALARIKADAEPSSVVSPEPTLAPPEPAPVADGSAFDHDHDGMVGGRLPKRKTKS